ncbi:MAG: ParA family protein [Planctomycetes bacterium]|nr:ParA family protein [Planctomycetota bacterium]MBM4083639.1 ParA family protein [Planctomycetota bacterium]
MRAIALINQKGGVGKTTCTANLGAALASHGKRVLMVDIDPQANLSVHYGIKVYQIPTSIYFLLVGQATLNQTIMKTMVDGLDIIPSNIDLAGAEIELVGMPGREMILKEAMNGVETRYDYLLVDCPPSLGLLTLNALTTVSEIFIPLQTEFFALQGMSKLLETFEIVKKRLNHSLEITGIIPCMFDARTRLSQEVLENIREYFENKVFKSIIRKNVKLAEAPSHGKPINVYAADSHGAADFMALAKEVIAQENSKGPTPIVQTDACMPAPTVTG